MGQPLMAHELSVALKLKPAVRTWIEGGFPMTQETQSKAAQGEDKPAPAPDSPDMFHVNGIQLQVPDAVLGDASRARLIKGRYEHGETAALERHLTSTDRLLELGSGTGYLACLASRIAGADKVTGVEAIPIMFETAKANLARNGFDKTQLHWGAAVPDAYGPDHVEFSIVREFWASGIGGGTGSGKSKKTLVPALKISDLLAQTRATVLLCDIEGGELALFDQELPAHLRLIIMELHPKVYGGSGLARLFSALAGNGFAYHPWGSRAAVVVFERF